MSDELDWLAAIQAPDVPEPLRDLCRQADQIFSNSRQTGPREAMQQIDQLLITLLQVVPHETLPQWRQIMEARESILERKLVIAMKADLDPQECLAIFREIGALALRDPATKSRISIVFFSYLERHLSAESLAPLVRSLMDELKTCRTVCDEYLTVLRTFPH